MKIDSVNMQNYTTGVKQKTSSPAFTAVHPAKYFVKCDDGEFRQVKSSKLVKSLQRKLVVWLNKLHNDSIKIMNGKAPALIKSETAVDKSLRERLVRFFVNNDRDYAHNKIVRSFYSIDWKTKDPKPYILTGQSVNIVEEAAKPIGQIKADIKHKTNVISEYYGINTAEAQKYVSGETLELMQATLDYHNGVEFAINKILSRKHPNDKVFSAFFVPQIKGKTIKYELVDATLTNI